MYKDFFYFFFVPLCTFRKFSLLKNLLLLLLSFFRFNFHERRGSFKLFCLIHFSPTFYFFFFAAKIGKLFLAGLRHVAGRRKFQEVGENF